MNEVNKNKEKSIMRIKGDITHKTSECINDAFPIQEKTQKEVYTKKLWPPNRIWCTQCDVDMEKKGIALDCPKDGTFYICPKCKHRIVVFGKEKRLLDSKYSELYQKALELWGKDLQLNMVFEELGELITKLSRVIRTRIPPTDLAEEIVDVEIMLEQLTYIYKLEEEVQHTKTEKLVRLQEKLGIHKKILWFNNSECPQCGKAIEDPKKIRANETGYSYCSDECAVKHVDENAPEGGY